MLNKTEAERGSTFYFIKDFSGARVHGSGAYRYRMVLLHPVSERVMPNQPYAIGHSTVNLPFVADEKDIFQGVTDRYGRTDVFAFEQPVNPQGWNLRRRTGQGRYGEQMVLRDQHGQPLQGYLYTLAVCGKQPWRYDGLTDALGQTAYVATSEPQHIVLYEYESGPLSVADIQKDCQDKTAASASDSESAQGRQPEPSE